MVQAQPLVQPVKQIRVWHQVRAQRWDIEFGGQELCAHSLMGLDARADHLVLDSTTV